MDIDWTSSTCCMPLDLLILNDLPIWRKHFVSQRWHHSRSTNIFVPGSLTLLREQFVALHANTTTISWVNKVGQPEQIESRQKWTDHFVQWSSRGSYLATVHSSRNCAVGWPLLEDDRLGFRHQGVKLIDFSPQESYLITWSPHDSRRAGEPNLLVWDIFAQRLAKGFRH